jgi:hypothetical protein
MLEKAIRQEIDHQKTVSMSIIEIPSIENKIMGMLRSIRIYHMKRELEGQKEVSNPKKDHGITRIHH